MRVDVYHHLLGEPRDLERLLRDILDRLTGLGLQGAQIMATEQEALAAIQGLKDTLANVAGDVTELIALAHVAGGVPQSVMDGLAALQASLASVAAEWPEAPPVVPAPPVA